METWGRAVSVPKYFELDASFEGKLELLEGVLVAIDGASPRHNLIVTNLACAFHGGPNFVFLQRQRVRIDATNSYVYPDLVIVRDSPRVEPRDPYSLQNPAQEHSSSKGSESPRGVVRTRVAIPQTLADARARPTKRPSFASPTSELRDAAARLTPVVIRTADGVRCEGMLDSVTGRGATARLIISPVQAKAASRPGCTRIFCSEEGWVFTATSTFALDAQTLAVDIASGVLTRIPARRSRYQTSSDRPVLLVVPRGLGEVHVLPVVDVGADIVAVDSPVGLRPGDALTSVDLWADRGCIRHADAEVLDSAPWYDLEGRSRFRLRLRLRTAATGGTTGYDLIAEPDKIKRLFELTSLLASEGDLGDGTTVTIAALADDRVELHARGRIALSEKTRRTLRFQLFDVAYEADVRVIEQDGATLSIAWPVVVRRFRQRSESRTAVGDRSVRIEYADALSGEVHQREVLDLSFGGARFSIDEAADIFWDEMPLSSVVLRWGTHAVSLGRVRVRGAVNGTCRVSFDNNLADDPELGELLTTLRHPELVVQDGSDFDRPYELFKRVELLEDFMVEGVDARIDEVRDNWRRLHSSPDICRSVMRQEGDDAVATMSTVQAWSGTWLGQHMAALPGRRGCDPGSLFSAYLDHVLLRPDCRFMAFFTSTENGRMNEIHRHFHELTGSSEAFSESGFDIWRVPAGFETPRSLNPPEVVAGHHDLIAHAARRTLGTMPSAALGMNAREMELESVSRRFQAAGLKRTRRVRVSVEAGVPRLAMLDERTSVGVNLTGMLDASWLLPLHHTRNGIVSGTVLDSSLQSLERQEGRLVIVPRGFAETMLAARGLQYLVSAVFYVLNRAGLRRYVHYLADSYGEINARRQTRGAA